MTRLVVLESSDVLTAKGQPMTRLVVLESCAQSSRKSLIHTTCVGGQRCLDNCKVLLSFNAQQKIFCSLG